MLVDGYERGIRFFETADAYGAHGVVGEALSRVGRKNVTVLTKTMAETEKDAQADLERFFRELGTDYIDIVLLHIRTSPTWTNESAGAMEVLARAKKQGRIRAHGVSCHSIEALRLATKTDWVDVDLARINPLGSRMDADPQTVLTELDAMKAAGKSVLGMKIFGGGKNTRQFDQAISHAARLKAIDAFTIGFTSLEQLDQVAAAIAEA
jgi:aryl-alcohol dehydrogenase-like predicted oxidoreductase